MPQKPLKQNDDSTILKPDVQWIVQFTQSNILALLPRRQNKNTLDAEAPAFQARANRDLQTVMCRF